MSPQELRSKDRATRSGAAGSGALRTTGQRNDILLLSAAAYLVVFYALTNYFPLRPPRTMPMLPFESAIGIHPATCWIYLSYFVMLVFTGSRLRKLEWAPRAAGAIAAVVTMSGAVFLIYPTTILRPPIVGGGVSADLLRLVRALDPPNNCFPSLHVGLAFLCSMLLMRASRRTGTIVLLWAALVAVSTLTTKQHYFLDVVGGLFVAGVGFALFFAGSTGRSRSAAVPSSSA
jgi:membrane-associated phospholipid phosphatase